VRVSRDARSAAPQGGAIPGSLSILKRLDDASLLANYEEPLPPQFMAAPHLAPDAAVTASNY
jgi:hypothetical protein